MFFFLKLLFINLAAVTTNLPIEAQVLNLIQDCLGKFGREMNMEMDDYW